MDYWRTSFVFQQRRARRSLSEEACVAWIREGMEDEDEAV
jgi:hypothetical protein